MINSSDDHETLQKDINYLNQWSTENLIRFHPGKCKTLIFSNEIGPHNNMFTYTLGNVNLEHTSSEKDLGVDITPNLKWQLHCERIISKASQKFGLLRRTCYFLKEKAKCRSLYIALVRETTI